MSLSRIIYILLFFVICWSGYYLTDKEKKADIQVAPNLELPMFSGDVLSNTSYDKDGIRSYIITSHHLDYYAQSGNTIFEKPILKVYLNGKELEWRITAEKGILTSKHELTLYDNVLAKSFLTDSGFDYISTAKLSIQLTSRDFWTDTAVTMKGLQFETHGQALEGNFSKRTARLYNHVQGRYENLTP